MTAPDGRSSIVKSTVFQSRDLRERSHANKVVRWMGRGPMGTPCGHGSVGYDFAITGGGLLGLVGRRIRLWSFLVFRDGRRPISPWRRIFPASIRLRTL